MSRQNHNWFLNPQFIKNLNYNQDISSELYLQACDLYTDNRRNSDQGDLDVNHLTANHIIRMIDTYYIGVSNHTGIAYERGFEINRDSMTFSFIDKPNSRKLRTILGSYKTAPYLINDDVGVAKILPLYMLSNVYLLNTRNRNIRLKKNAIYINVKNRSDHQKISTLIPVYNILDSVEFLQYDLIIYPIKDSIDKRLLNNDFRQAQLEFKDAVSRIYNNRTHATKLLNIILYNMRISGIDIDLPNILKRIRDEIIIPGLQISKDQFNSSLRIIVENLIKLYDRLYNTGCHSYFFRMPSEYDLYYLLAVLHSSKFDTFIKLNDDNNVFHEKYLQRIIKSCFLEKKICKQKFRSYYKENISRLLNASESILEVYSSLLRLSNTCDDLKNDRNIELESLHKQGQMCDIHLLIIVLESICTHYRGSSHFICNIKMLDNGNPKLLNIT